MSHRYLRNAQVVSPGAYSGWVAPEGEWVFVEDAGHNRVAVKLTNDPRGDETLEREGWVHVSYTGVYHSRPLTSAQVDSLYEALWACNAQLEQGGWHPHTEAYAIGLQKALDSEN